MHACIQKGGTEINKFLPTIQVLICVLILSTVIFAASCNSVNLSNTSTTSTILTLNSPAFSTGAVIPVKYTQQGDNVSPPLIWNNVPQGTKSYVLMAEDIDGPNAIITHWILFNIPDNLQQLKEGIPIQDQLSDGSIQGSNVRGSHGYVGPSPPIGTTHRYEFTLFALDEKLSLAAGADRTDVISAIQGHILAVGQTMGIYSRR